MTKLCSKCGEEKDIDMFYKSKKVKSWIDNPCKECRDINKKEYYASNKDKWKNCWKYIPTEKNRERNRIQRSKRRALVNGTADKTITYKSTQELLSKQNNKCNYCSIDITDRDSRHLDHIYPISKWWSHSINNVQWLCCRCNLKKSDLIL